MSKFILFDVGANLGQDSIPVVTKNPNAEAWVFEPMPAFCDHINQLSKNFQDRYHLYPLAMSDYDGESTFYVATSEVGFSNGANSLYPFVDHLNETWPGRIDLKTEREITVQVTRFDTWYRENNLNLERIDYFHCDTQGSDLKVLQGMGDLVHLIQKGVVECARDERAKLYAENHTMKEMEDFLLSKGFVITNRQSNDAWSNELNLYFEKR